MKGNPYNEFPPEEKGCLYLYSNKGCIQCGMPTLFAPGQEVDLYHDIVSMIEDGWILLEWWHYPTVTDFYAVEVVCPECGKHAIVCPRQLIFEEMIKYERSITGPGKADGVGIG